MRLVVTRHETFVESLHQVGRAEITHVPLADDDRRRARIDQGTRQTGDAIARNLAEARRTTAQRHEICVQVEPKDLRNLEPTIFALARPEDQRGFPWPIIPHETMHR